MFTFWTILWWINLGENLITSPNKSCISKKRQSIGFFFVSSLVVPHHPKCRDLPHSAPQVPPIPSYPPCCRGKRTIYYSLLHIDIKSYKFYIQTDKTPNYHGKFGQFLCLYHILHISTAYSTKLIPFSAKISKILSFFTFPLHTITETPDFCVIVYFCLIVRFSPQSPSYQRHPKPKKAGPTTHRDEPHQALKPLILSHSSILLPASTQIPMALFLNSRLCRC